MIPVAERAIASGRPDELLDLLGDALDHEIRTRLAQVVALRGRQDGGVAAARARVEATLSFQVWAHRLHEALQARPHEHQETHD